MENLNSVIIVTGASGFIAQQLITDLLRSGYYIIGIDTKDPNNEFENTKAYKHLKLDLLDFDKYKSLDPDYIFSESLIVCVCHLAAKIRVDESVKEPLLYYDNNVNATVNLLKWCSLFKISNIIFASTAAVYSGTMPNDGFEETQETPLNGISSPYGKSKLMDEIILIDSQMKGYIFRFFNVCGGYEPELIHLLPIIVNNLITNKDIKIYGTDYQTRDGSCLRDYIHLKDISAAFLRAINKGFSFNDFKIYNLGSNVGYTVKEIISRSIDIYNEIKGSYKNSVITHPRRSGDADVLLANSNKARLELKWEPEFNLDRMIRDTIRSFLVQSSEKGK